MDGIKPNYNTINFIIMNATHFIEVWKSNISPAKNGILLPIDFLEESLAKTIKLELTTIAIFKIKTK
jgi:hypothetical protein